MGSGGAPEGVLAASALKCMGGQMLGRLLFRNDDEREPRRARPGSPTSTRSTTRDEMVTEDVIFSATGVTDGSIVHGARRDGEWMETETILMRSKTGSVRRLFYRQHNQ